MRSAAMSGFAKRLTPNLKYVVRDRTHASRRLTSRPWAADPFLKDVVSNFCRGKGSVSRLIQNSPENQRMFKKFCTTSFRLVRSVASNMRAAGHRFESFARPLGRSCYYLHAVCASITLSQLTVLRAVSVLRAAACLQPATTSRNLASSRFENQQLIKSSAFAPKGPTASTRELNPA